MLPELPTVTQCATCQHFYWIEEAPILGELDVFADPDRGLPAAWYQAPYITELDLQGLRAALDAGAAITSLQEHYLRLRLWWKHNDSYRSTTPDTTSIRDDDVLQPTAFGAADRCNFSAFVCGAPRQRLSFIVRRQPSSTLPLSILSEDSGAESPDLCYAVADR
jgi:hypothetical protein